MEIFQADNRTASGIHQQGWAFYQCVAQAGNYLRAFAKMEESRKKHSLVIGGTRGIGRALVGILSREGHIVSVIGRRAPQEKDRAILNTNYWTADITDQKLIYGVLANIVKQNGKLSNLVFYQRYRGEGDKWAGEMETSLTATKSVIEHLIDKFEVSSGNSIVVVSSIAGSFIADEQPLSYHAAKGALIQMVRYYAAVLGAKGIRVNSVSPSTILKEESKDFYLQNEQLHNLYKKIIPLGRMGTSEDIANVISFLCSSKSSFITGQNIVVDGGISLQGHEALARKLALDK